jgi:uncharacterized membrane protein
MNGLLSLGAATAAFVGSHFILSHPLRRPIVGRIGEGAFLGLYSLVALASFAWLVLAARAAPEDILLWTVPDFAWDVAAIAMLIASILFAGSLIGNPAAPNPAGQVRAPIEAMGVYAVTRHPMMWSFILWAIAHALLWPTAANLIVSAGIAVLAFFGARAQDAKKAALVGESWRDWEARTAFWPFGAQIHGGKKWPDAVPGAGVLLGGLTLWLIATAAHEWLEAPSVGIWRWFG